MKGLLQMDWYVAKRYCKSLLLLVVIFAAASAYESDNGFFLYYPTVLTALLPASLLAWEEKSNWLLMTCTMPCSRRAMVVSKYLDSLICLLLCLVLACGARLVHMSLTLSQLKSIAALYCTLGLGMPSLLLPFLFRFGTERGRIASLVTIGILCVAGAMFPIDAAASLAGRYLPLGAALLFVISLLVSVRCYQTRKL